MPELVLIPAPVTTTIFLDFHKKSAMSWRSSADPAWTCVVGILGCRISTKGPQALTRSAWAYWPVPQTGFPRFRSQKLFPAQIQSGVSDSTQLSGQIRRMASYGSSIRILCNVADRLTARGPPRRPGLNELDAFLDRKESFGRWRLLNIQSQWCRRGSSSVSHGHATESRSGQQVEYSITTS